MIDDGPTANLNCQNAGLSLRQLQEIDQGLASPDAQTHWQAAIALGAFSETVPEAIWPLVEKWGACLDEDTRTAIATCVLEHVLEAHFEPFIERVELLIQQENVAFAATFSECWQFGQAKLPENSKRFLMLQARAEKLWGSRRRKGKLKASLSQRQQLRRRQRRFRSRMVSAGAVDEARLVTLYPEDIPSV